MSKRSGGNTEEKVRKPSRYLRETNQRYWIRIAIITVGLFVAVAWFSYPARGPAAFLWAAGLSGAVLVYFIISYYKFRR